VCTTRATSAASPATERTEAALLIGGALAFLAALWPPARPLQSVLGVLERVNVYGCMLWLMVLAIALLRDARATTPHANVWSPA
jgi:hypothetical protein